MSPIAQFDAAAKLLVTVSVMDADSQTVFRAVITMRASPNKGVNQAHIWLLRMPDRLIQSLTMLVVGLLVLHQ
jgi:hypothetical protein